MEGQATVNRLQQLLGIIQNATTPGNPEAVLESFVCPLKYDVAALLRKRAALRIALQQAEDFLKRALAEVPSKKPSIITGED